MPTPKVHARKAVDAWLNDPLTVVLDAMVRPVVHREPDDLVPWIAEEIRQAKTAVLQTAITAIGALESDGENHTIDDAINAIRAIMRNPDE